MAPLPPRSTALQRFFVPIGEERSPGRPRQTGRPLMVKTGSLVSFGYTLWRNDPYPMIVVIDPGVAGDKISGVNLHYLTFRDIKEIISQAGKMGFSYRSVSNSAAFRGSYRSYKKVGVQQMRVLDPSYLLGVMGMVRSHDPAESEIIRRQVQEQLRQPTNPKASQATNLNQAGEDSGLNGG